MEQKEEGRVNSLFLPELGHLSFPALGHQRSWFFQLGLSYTTHLPLSPAYREQTQGTTWPPHLQGTITILNLLLCVPIDILLVLFL